MTKRMLIDATHAEETRVVVLDGSRLDEFDVETASRRQLKGNIYLAKVVRVEPSLQAAFVEYGGNRHGFLAFGEIHPDYYQIPVADRQRLIALQAEEARREEEEEDRAAEADERSDAQAPLASAALQPDAEPSAAEVQEVENADGQAEAAAPYVAIAEQSAPEQAVSEEAAPELARPDQSEQGEAEQSSAAQPAAIATEALYEPVAEPAEPSGPELAVDASDDVGTAAEPHAHGLAQPEPGESQAGEPEAGEPEAGEPEAGAHEAGEHEAGEHDFAAGSDANGHEPAPPAPETIGGTDEVSEDGRRRSASRALRSYKIQEVIKRRQILLVQVVKEERGGKGAALTTYISLAGRYCVLMPNSPRGGGVSRKITSAADRRRLKEVTAEIGLPPGIGLIVRTAGANRPKQEIVRDCEYLLRMWDDIREHTMASMAPALIYEEASLIKRAIRDVYSRDIDEILVDGEDGFRAARNFMNMIIPSHARKVQLWNGGGQPLFAKHQVDEQLDGMLQPNVQLRSGGYLVINQTEALVAIDVNSGRSTRERGIEETALKTNLEAADELARQLRLRDLAGLIVIDFIDMESRRNNAAVEKRLKDALKDDRARIQLGSISAFGLMEMSRQRLRPSIAETSSLPCPHCGGTGMIRSTENAAIHVLRAIEDEGGKRRAAEIVVHLATAVALYVLNNKRDRLGDIEQRYAMRVLLAGDDTLIAPEVRIERVRAATAREDVPPARIEPPTSIAFEAEPEDIEDGDDPADVAEAEAPVPGETAEEGEQRRRKRRRRRRGGRREGQPPETATEAADPDATHVEGVPEHDEPAPVSAELATAPVDGAPVGEISEEERVRRRSRRGGRRRRRDDGAPSPVAEPGAEQPDVPVYAGPTPADPFGGQVFDIFDVMDQAEQEAARPAVPIPESAALPEAAPEPVSPEPAAAEPAVTTQTEPDASPIVERLPEPEPAATADLDIPPVPEPVAEPHPAQAVEPEAPEPEPAEKRRGWWRA